MKWRLKSNVEIDEDTGNPLYWSNDMGWVTKEDSDTFSEKEREDFNDRAEIMDAAWVRE